MSISKKERIKDIKAMLLEMASGNFFYRLERYAKNDNLEAISISLNMLAEEIQATNYHQGFSNSNSPILDLVQMSFIIDKNGTIEMANQQACNILSVLMSDVIGTPFISFLEPSSQITWKALENNLIQKKISESSLELKFKTKSDLLIPKIAYVTSFHTLHSKIPKLLITIIHHSNHQKKLDKELKTSISQYIEEEYKSERTTENQPTKSKIRLSFEDIRKIRKGRDILLSNLKADFPLLRDFALLLGTNEFKLKYGFKELYGTTVHRFLMNERFRNAQMMIQFSDESLKSIAHINGFKSISHFSRSFKKRYGYAPSVLRKKSRNKDN
ncbi:helix-turn-helix domain-containing protein [Cellulophaga sp. Hel_I_12]|uniref:helix-turn-helix domain-containing protein n=1 Tax=Cellulophaga sp. Hel_I_12 TaxID=1249972 RepID=UPI00068DF519|nr:helix-turn-helix domain-containing protein [Cellulophaga sp. Hel_I_12]